MTTIRSIIDATADHYEITASDITGPSRQAAFCHPRQVAMCVAHKLTAASLPTIGREFRRDHTTVMHALASVKRRACPDEREAAEKITENVLGGVFRSVRARPTFTTRRRYERTGR